MKHNEVLVQKLVFPDNIRTRQGMYGSNGEDADILLREIIDNAVDVVLKNRVSISITSFTDVEGYHIVWDTGTGVPIYADPDHDNLLPITVDLLTQINVGSNFVKTQYSAGMNGVGSKLTNALSESFDMYVNASKKDPTTFTDKMKADYESGSKIFAIRFQKGLMTECGLVNTIPAYSDKVSSKLANLPDNFGTLVVFKPDATLLTSTSAKYHGYPFKIMNSLFKHDPDFNHLSAPFTINGKTIEPFKFTDTFKCKLIGDKVFGGAVSVKTNEPLPVKFVFEFAYSQEDFISDYEGSVNLLKTTWGKHITLFQSALGRALNQYNGIISAADAKYGLRCFVLAMAIEPLFNSQDKSKLSKFEDKGYDDAALIKEASDYILNNIIKTNSAYFDLLCARIIEYKHAMNNLSNIELLKSKVILGDESDKRRAMSGDMSKVYEATSRDYSKRELFIPEGLSAGASLVKYRNKVLQSVLPIRGKLINTTSFNENDLVGSKEVLAIINTIGCGIGQIVDVTKSRYARVIIATDADSDGLHISNLITALFLIHAPAFIKAGMLYKLETPYFAVTDRKGTEYFYYDQKDKIDYSKHVEKRKGLGSYTPDEVKKFMLDYDTRRIVQITYDDARQYEIDEATKLMHSSSARKQLMVKHGILSE